MDPDAFKRLDEACRMANESIRRRQVAKARTDIAFVEALCQIGCGNDPDELASLTRIHQAAASVLLEAQMEGGT